MTEPYRPVVGIIQARMGSTRLPGKTLHPIVGKPLLGHIVERMRACTLLDGLFLATTNAPEDQALVAWARQEGLPVYAGSVEDVLDRYYRAARIANAQTIVRITADDAFKDPDVVDRAVQVYIDHFPDLDYVSNTLQPTYPEGLDIEVFSFRALERAWKEARLASEREHVTPYIWKHPERFRVYNFRLDRDLSHLRWTVDYPEDMTFVQAVYERLYRPDEVFRMADILALLEAEPSLKQINQGFQRNAGYIRSLANDAVVVDEETED